MVNLGTLPAPDMAIDARLQRQLADFNQRRLRPGLPDDEIHPDAHALHQTELRFLEAERRKIAATAAQAPDDPDGFVRWFEALREHGAGQGDPLFPWLAEIASLAQVRWFLAQEVAGEAGFDDLLALTQVQMPAQAKLEMARNFWDELGRGHATGMHGPMLARLAATVQAHLPIEAVVPESLALANLMMAMAANRPYAYHSVGALGVIELTAPDRAEQVNAALKRHGLAAHDRQYFALHATLDKRHSAAWDREVLASLVAAEPRTARAMAEGALLRLAAGARCFARYRRHFGQG